MTLASPFFRSLVLPCCVGFGAIACSSGSTTITTLGGTDGGADTGGPVVPSPDGAADDGGPVIPRVIVSGSLDLGVNAVGACTEGATLAIGTFGEPPTKPAEPVESGATWEGEKVTVTCSVVPDATGQTYAVDAKAAIAGAGGAAVTLKGAMTSAGEQTGIAATFARAAGAVFASSDCVFRFSAPAGGIAAGRLWGEIDCASAKATPAPGQCRIRAEVRFENCEQR